MIMKYNSFQEAKQAWDGDITYLAELGVSLPDVQAYLPEPFRKNFSLAMDAAGTLTTAANSAIPAMLTTLIDPEVTEILFAPNNASKILGERRKGTWLDDTAMFPVVEHTGEVSSYGDFSENGHVGANTNWPNRQSYLFQTVKEYGERELERAGLAKLNWVGEQDKAAATVMNKFSNLTYFFGITGLQNYGLVNDPSLPASISPGTKAVGTPKWINNGVVTATANEIFTDIQSLFAQLVTQSAGLIDADASLVLAMAPAVSVALTQTNSFNVNVYDLLKKNFPNIRFETAVQYGAKSTTNPQGITGGNLVQMIAPTVEGQDTGYVSFNEKMKSFPIIKAMSSYKQKIAGGTWGAIIRQPFAFASMLGV
jgi:hypothetical protein